LVSTRFPHQRGRGSSIFVDASGIDRFLTSYAKVVFETKKSLFQKHATTLGNIVKKSRGLFRDRIIRPRESSTLGGFTYRPGDRATGRFTFGDQGAFKGVVFDIGDQQGFGFPEIPVADAKTDKAWRALEYGLPANRHRMPKGIWLNEAGQRVGDKAEGGIFQPLRGQPAVTGHASGITEKRFIRDAWEEGTKNLPREYKALFVQHFQRFSKE
jgi:hypothetical protein